MIPLGAALTLLFSLAALTLPRVYAALGVMAGVCYITQGQQYVVGGFHMHAIRIVLLTGFVRLVIRGDFRGLKLNKIDWALIGYASATTFIPSLRERTMEEFVYRLGCAYDILLAYWVFRGLIRSWEEFSKYLAGLAFLIVPLALEMILEMMTSRSLFVPFGGIGELTIREGRARAQGAFRIGITAGVFGATLIPVFVALFRAGGRKGTAVIGLLSALAITYTSNSSGPLMAGLCSIVAWVFWPMRERMSTVRRGIVGVLIGLHLCMKVPVWFIFSKLGALTGGDGWHRSYLIDRFFHFFPSWWLMGTNNTHDWMPYVLPDGNADITDLYVAAGINGGLAALVLLILLLVRCFRYLGRAMAELRDKSFEAETFYWGLGGALFAHVVTLFSVTYWDQVFVVLWSLLAIIASVSDRVAEENPATETIEEASSVTAELRPVSELP